MSTPNPAPDGKCNAPGPVEDCPRHAHLAKKWRPVGRIGWSGNVPTYSDPHSTAPAAPAGPEEGGQQ